jgi:hypothetical protein
MIRSLVKTSATHKGKTKENKRTCTAPCICFRTLFRDGHLKLKDLKKMGYDQEEIELIQRAAKDLRQNTPNSSKVIDSVVGSEKAIKNELVQGGENIQDAIQQYAEIKKRADKIRRMRRSHE